MFYLFPALNSMSVIEYKTIIKLPKQKKSEILDQTEIKHICV